ncbi:hypothetical protein PVAND_016993 [Polypedilum vanderplanki]|uniref:Odorant receptor n=1 Tax=Polypedilum vanderplanki TaxID=319348 RepID=A0A9J6BHF3_POLVA|nr:hypothetical protein PVAND_016993 [Polypedilum vanderplanki]
MEEIETFKNFSHDLHQSLRNFKHFLSNFVTNLKSFLLKSNHVHSMFIAYNEFFKCEKILQLLGCTFLPTYLEIDLSLRKFHYKIACIGLLTNAIHGHISFVISGNALLRGDKNYVFMFLENLSVTGIFMTVLVKAFLLLFKHKNHLQIIIERIEQYFPKSGTDQVVFKTDKYLKLIKTFYFVLVVHYSEVLLQFCLIPFLHKFWGWYFSNDVQWEPILSLIYPFDQQQPIIYCMIYLLNFWLLMVLAFISSATDLLFASMTNVLSMEFDNLAQIISGIDWDDDDNHEEAEEKAIEKLKILINVHNDLCDIAQNLNNIFSPLLLINMVASICSLCIFAFLAASKVSNFFLIKYSAAFVGVFLQIYIHCYFGEQLTNSSNGVADGVYNSAWYKASPKFRKMAMMIMKRAQREQKIRAWKFANVNLNFFYWIVTTAHSYYSFLSGVYTH